MTKTHQLLKWVLIVACGLSMQLTAGIDAAEAAEKKEPLLLTAFSDPLNPAVFGSEAYAAKLIKKASSIFVATSVEAMRSDILERSHSKSKVWFNHVWVKHGWKKPVMKNMDLDIDFGSANGGRENGSLERNKKYLYFMKGESILEIIPLSSSSKDAEIGKKYLAILGEEDWYYNRVNNLIEVNH